MNGKVSVIVPVYNATDYLPECIESIICQTYRNIEIILIDNGSSDSSLEVCKTYAKKDQRITVTHLDKRGVSIARNTGIDIATGDYIVFTDADDTLPEISIQSRVEALKDADMVVGMYTTMPNADPYKAANIGRDFWTTEEALDGVILSRPYQGYIWNKLFLKTIIETNGLRFSEEITYNEDRLFCVEYVLHCKKTNICHENVYNYRLNPDGVMAKVGSTTDNERNDLLSDLDAFDRILALLKRDYPIYFFKTATEAHKRTLQLKRAVPQGETGLQRELNNKLLQYSIIAAGAPGFAVSLEKKIKLFGHAILKR